MTANSNQTDKIAALNDRLQQTFLAGRIELSEGILALPQDQRIEIIDKVEHYDSFAPQGVAQKEKDFGAYCCGEHDVFWEINCYDENGVWTCFNRDDPSKTDRILSIRLINEMR